MVYTPDMMRRIGSKFQVLQFSLQCRDKHISGFYGTILRNYIKNVELVT